MKTAMQELIETLEKDIKYINEFDSKEDKYYRQGLKYAYNLANEKLNAEKQQIIEAVKFTEHTAGYSGEEYYNDTFN